MNRFRDEAKQAARHCSECGSELYADEELICQECLDANLDIENNHGDNK